MAIRFARDAALRLRPPEEPAPVEVTLYHDVLCSWCYVADGRLEYLRDEYGPTLRWSLRPYPLRPENQIPDKRQRSVLARHFRRLGREQIRHRVRRGFNQQDLASGADRMCNLHIK